MVLFTKRDSESSIVLVGKFYPLLLVPQWFVRHGLLSDEEVEEQLQIECILKEFTKFSLSSITIEIQEDRIVLRCTLPEFNYLIKDLATGIIANLPELEITSMGLNFTQEIEFHDEKFWHFSGDYLAPKTIWEEIVPNSPRVGLRTLNLQASKRDEEIGVFNFTYAWSNKPLWSRLVLNHHITNGNDILDKKKKDFAAKKFDPYRIIIEDWDSTLDLGCNSTDHLLNRLVKEYHGS